ncbi:HalOD1 output domain-containing protein [Halopenitus sp. H-Gu1]|uniref:HalOD1 output domain-containing protein n=1 Tax=Halopenitus sp. H-Gu1 TaxID=3242697 RepID=UPI00359CEC07
MEGMNGPVSERVIRNVAETTDSDPLDLPLLYDAVDPDALNAIIESMSDGEVTFTYAGHEVTVTSDGAISLDEKSAARSAPEAAVTSSSP